MWLGCEVFALRASAPVRSSAARAALDLTGATQPTPGLKGSSLECGLIALNTNPQQLPGHRIDQLLILR